MSAIAITAIRSQHQKERKFMGTENKPGQQAPGQQQQNPKPGQEGGDKHAQQPGKNNGDRMPGRQDQDEDRGGQKSEPGRQGGDLQKQAGTSQR
jgi:hypothetical protein